MSIDPGNVLLDRLKGKIDSGQNLLLAFVGPTRSGKSWSALKFSQSFSALMGVPFSVDNVVFTPEEFIQRISIPNLPRGTVIVWDEAGVGMPARQWFEISNKVINEVSQTFGHLGLVVIFTTPFLSYIDSDLRKLFHAYVEMLSKGGKDYRVGKWFDIQVAHRQKNKIYYKRPVYFDSDGSKKVIDYLRFYRIDASLASAYEPKAREYKLKVMTLAANEVVGYRARVGQVDVDEIAKMVLDNPKRFTREFRGRRVIDQGLIERDFKVGNRIAARVKSAVRISLPPTLKSSLSRKKTRRLAVRRAINSKSANYIG